MRINHSNYLKIIFGILFFGSINFIKAQPAEWYSVGIGGGGALFSPSISPHKDSEYYVACDMTDLFHSQDAGESWEVIPFTKIRSFPETKVQFTSDPDVLYALHNDFVTDRRTPVMSNDGGKNWSPLPQDPTDGEAYYLLADPGSSSRLIVTNYETIFYSEDAGKSFREIYSNIENDGAYVAGSFWQKDEIFIATSRGILHSINDGSEFQLKQFPGISSAEGIVSFSAAENDQKMRFFVVTLNREDIYPTVTGADHWGFVSCYTLDYNDAKEWIAANNGLGTDDHPFFVKSDPRNPDIAYLGGGNGETAFPIIFKTENGGQSWIEVFKTINNENIATGWSGYRGDFDWWYGEYVLGLDISPTNSAIVVFTDLGYVHSSRDGGQSWQQNYVLREDQNPPGLSTPQGLNYRTNGLENTSCWWLTWTGPENLFASFTDITAIRSIDGGNSWSRNYSNLDYNSVYQVLNQVSTGLLYAGVSSIHDIYQSTYLQDEDFDGGEGAVMYSTDNGAGWNMLHDFGDPVIWLTIDPNNSNRMYASVVSSNQGGIYKTENLAQLAGSQWERLSSPPRTEGHPLSIHALEDGALVTTYSGRRSSNGAFTASSGVFISSDGGQTWEDRSDPAMLYWTKDLIIDPHDLIQSTWYVGVHSGWGGAPNSLGGLYKTTDRGINWDRILVLDRVESCSISPDNPHIMYITTEAEGLWYTNQLDEDDPNFHLLESYPFQHPMRVFFDPFETDKVWVTSFGNGIRVGTSESILSSTTNAAQIYLSAFPNPARNRLTINLHLRNSGSVKLSLVTIKGEIISTIRSGNIAPETLNTFNLDLSNIPQGIYLLLTESGANISTEKIIVLK